MAKHERPADQPESKPQGNMDPRERGRGGTDPRMGQDKYQGKHRRD